MVAFTIGYCSAMFTVYRETAMQGNFLRISQIQSQLQNFNAHTLYLTINSSSYTAQWNQECFPQSARQLSFVGHFSSLRN